MSVSEAFVHVIFRIFNSADVAFSRLPFDGRIVYTVTPNAHGAAIHKDRGSLTLACLS